METETDFRTAQSVLDWLERKIRSKEIIDSHTWVQSAEYLNILSVDETDRLFDLQQSVAKEKVKYIEDGKSVAQSKTMVEASDIYKDMLKQSAKLSRITEAIRIAKIQARLADQSYRNN